MSLDVTALHGECTETIELSHNLDALEEARLALFGKKGKLTLLMKQLGGMSPDERRTVGAELNRLREEIKQIFDTKKQLLERAAIEEQLNRETIDVTLPPRPEQQGTIHPLTQTIDELVAIFGEMGFTVAEGPDIEDDYFNFTAVNIPEEHPSRQDHDTFYFKETENGRKLLRTHTTPVQIRAMQKMKPPLRLLIPGRTFRCDDDATHSPNFHQVEGLVIDKDIHMGHLKECLLEFCRTFFNHDDLRIRFRPHYFPFTEPSAEVDIQCRRARDALVIGEGDDWLEILGCGMIHPNVLRNGGIDPEEYQGFAFGMGIERITMLKYGIPDLRNFFESDLRWHRHYGFSPLNIPNVTGGLN
jgi:phenylalanyl-tRNA synthetase alpha chain